LPRGFTVESFFADAFGIIVEPEVLKAERIRIKAIDINHRRGYLRKLPIHWSQREVEKHSDYSIFEVTVIRWIKKWHQFIISDAINKVFYMIVSTCSTNSLDSGCISRRGLYKFYAITYHVIVEWGNAAGIPFGFGVHNGVDLNILFDDGAAGEGV